MGETDSQDGWRAFIWKDGVMSRLVLPDSYENGAYAINNKGQVVGYMARYGISAECEAFLWNNGVVHNLGTLPGHRKAFAIDINDYGQVVGVSQYGYGEHRPFLWEHGCMYDLNDFLPAGSGWTLQGNWLIGGINNRGEIVGYSKNPVGQTHAFLLTPLPVLPDAAARLAREVVRAPYLYGGKGYDFAASAHKFVSAEGITVSGYRYWDPFAEGYRDGGLGVDCSGLILWAYNRAFYGDGEVAWGDAVVTQAFLDAHGGRWEECLRMKSSPVSCEGAGQQRLYNSYPISRDDLSAGDVLCFPGHIAMYVGDDVVVHAELPATGIVEESLTSFELKYSGQGILYRRIGKPDVMIIGHSPIDLVVTDPYGHIVSKGLCSLDCAEYLESDLDGNRELEDYVLIGLGTIGDYTVQVIPQEGASPEEMYSLWLGVGDQSGWLAQGVAISEIPSAGYEFHSDVPEPATLCFLCTGTIAMLLRRKSVRA